MAAGRQVQGQLPGQRFIEPGVLARIDNLELIARVVVDGFVSGLHRSPMLGMSVLPPRSRLTSAPTPAAIIASTAAGSQTANMATSSRPCSSTSDSTAIVSCVPPEAELSA